MKTASEFLEALENYYKIKYSMNDKTFLAGYLAKKINEIDDLKTLAFKVCECHSKVYKSLPDIAIINKCIPKKNLENEAAAMFETLFDKIDSRANFDTTNKRIYAGLARIGGWICLCKSMLDEKKWLKKDFISGYCSDVTGVEPRQMRGDTYLGECPRTVKLDYDGKSEIEYVNESQKKELESMAKYAFEGMGE